ncbi:MAG: DUF2917 domain-containing protein [Ignavibacteria bacterium]
MATITEEARIELSGRESLTLGGLRGHEIQCAAGELWLTLDGEGRDVILAPGGAYTVETNAELVVSAFKASVLRVSHCRHPAGRFARLAGALAALLELPHLSVR